MRPHDAIAMMERCRAEILDQRRELDRLRPKAEAYDLLRDAVALATPDRLVGHGEDMVWKLDQEIKAQEAMIVALKAHANEGQTDG